MVMAECRPIKYCFQCVNTLSCIGYNPIICQTVPYINNTVSKAIFTQVVLKPNLKSSYLQISNLISLPLVLIATYSQSLNICGSADFFWQNWCKIIDWLKHPHFSCKCKIKHYNICTTVTPDFYCTCNFCSVPLYKSKESGFELG